MKKDITVKDGLPGLGPRLMWRFGRFVARCLYNRKMNLVFENWNILKDIPAPYLIVANHVTNFDPVLVSANHDTLIHWVANDAVFRHPVLRWVFRRVQVIPKTKGMSDLDTVRIMHKKVREGGIVAVYPEGHTCWDGESLPLVPATAKLLKLLKVPVIGVVTKGGYISQPRWAWTKDLRRGRIVLEAKLLFTVEEVKEKSVEELDRGLEEGLYNDDFEYIKENPVVLESEKRAETLELFTYICPECRTLDALMSSGNNVTCQHCGWSFSIDKYGAFPQTRDFPFPGGLKEWNKWQSEVTSQMVKDYLALPSPQDPLLHNKDLTLLTGKGLVPLRKLCSGDLKLWQDRLEFLTGKGETMVFPLVEMEAPSIFKQQKFEFYYEKVLYRFHYPTPRDSAYKWFEFIS
ncbi:MAG: lysophospholipid acyltransferase family protein, partial [Spirochaetales bacterium]|nr:lysophospholipid acyltransferase family protein [Spirochaetales bacterium]